MSNVNSGINSKDHFIKRLHHQSPLTTIVGINCKDGIVLYADSQETYVDKYQRPTSKRVIQRKLSEIGKYRHYMMGCAGTTAYIEILIEWLNEHKDLEIKSLYPERKMHELLENDIIPQFIYKYDVKLPTLTHGIPTPDKIEIDVLFAARLAGEPKHMMYKIETEGEMTIRRVPQYGSIGSGSEIVTPLLDQINQILDECGYSWHDMSTRLAAKISHLVLGIGLQSDPATGGISRCKILKNGGGVIPINRTKVWKNPRLKLAETLSLACKELPNIQPKISNIVENLRLPKHKR